MAVAKDAAGAAVLSTTQSNGAHQVPTGLITVGAGATLLIAGQEVDVTTPGSISMTWDTAGGGTNQAMTEIGTLAVDSGGSATMNLVLFGVINPTAGNKNLTMSWTTGGPSYYMAMSFTGSDTTSVANATYGFAKNNAASGANATVTSGAAIASGDMALAVYNNQAGYSNAFTAGTDPGDGGTAIGKNEGLTTNMAAEYYSGAGSTIAASAAQAASQHFVAVIVGIKAAGGAAAAPVLATPRRVFLRRHHQPFATPRQFDRNRIVGWKPGLILPRRSLILPVGRKRAA